MQGFDRILMIFLIFFFALQLLFFKKYDFFVTPKIKSWIRHWSKGTLGNPRRHMVMRVTSSGFSFPTILIIMTNSNRTNMHFICVWLCVHEKRGHTVTASFQENEVIVKKNVFCNLFLVILPFSFLLAGFVPAPLLPHFNPNT